MTKMVSERATDLTNQMHADKLEEQIKSLREQLPNFLSSELTTTSLNRPSFIVLSSFISVETCLSARCNLGGNRSFCGFNNFVKMNMSLQ